MNRGLVIASCALIAAATAGCDTKTLGSDTSSHKVTYSVTGTGGVKKGDMTYTDGGTQTTQDTGAKLPYKKSVKVKGSDVIVYQISAQNTSASKGKIKCKITLDGKVVKTNVSSGQGAIASCQYTPK